MGMQRHVPLCSDDAMASMAGDTDVRLQRALQEVEELRSRNEELQQENVALEKELIFVKKALNTLAARYVSLLVPRAPYRSCASEDISWFTTSLVRRSSQRW